MRCDMNVSTFVPVLVEATKFMFSEVSKWIDEVRRKSKDPLSESSQPVVCKELPVLSQHEFISLVENPNVLMSMINVQMAMTNAYEIESLVQQIQIHRKNLLDFEATEAEFGSLTPQHVRRGIEREASATFEKSVRLKGFLQQIYGRKIGNT